MKKKQPLYEISTGSTWFTMTDGIRLAASIFKPLPRIEGERFPVLLELLPYRKDDSFYMRDYPTYCYFASRGYIAVKVDIRGTGSSQGSVPDREYSDREIEDACELIAALAKLPNSNGNVGMWGISWGGFNAIQTAMRRPPALKAIIAVDASDDLFHDDVHFLDGAMHVNWYELEIDHENGLPRSPHYRINKTYYAQRFSAYPWLLTFLKQQRDGSFWRRKSLRWQYESIDIPMYLIGGLLDGYRDSIPRMLESMAVPIKAEIGPWNHDFPDRGKPGPNYEWRHHAVLFFDRWLKGSRNNVMKKSFMVFVREGHGPNRNLTHTPGHWRYEEWPIKRTKWTSYFPESNSTLSLLPPAGGYRELAYTPTTGTAAEEWWGEPVGDMRGDDAYSLVFDSGVTDRPIEIIGFPKVKLRVSVDAPLAHWTARLEDVGPDGAVSLVTGAVANGSQRENRLKPSNLPLDSPVELEFDLHFTTWTFQPGHRIRLAVSNAQFPMIWPTPHSMTMKLHMGSTTSLQLPEIPFEKPGCAPRLPSPEPRLQRSDAEYLPVDPQSNFYRICEDRGRQTTSVSRRVATRYRIKNRIYGTTRDTIYTASLVSPACASFRGKMTTTIKSRRRKLRLTTAMSVRSDGRHFHVKMTRRLYRNGKLMKARTWKESIRRDFQ